MMTDEMMSVDGAVVTPPTNTTPRMIRMLREYALSMSIWAGIAAVTDWMDARNHASGAETLLTANLTLAIVAAICTIHLRLRYPGPQDLPLHVRVLLISAAPFTIALCYLLVYPLFWHPW